MVINHPKIDQKWRNADYRKRRKKEKHRFNEILKKEGPLQQRDVQDFYKGLSADERRLAGIMYIHKCGDAAMTASDLYDFLKDE